MFDLSLNRMEALALSISPNLQLAISNGLMTALFVDAWAAVMNFDAIGEVIRRLKIKSAEATSFEKEARQIRSLRNKFQHFSGNVINRARSKGPRCPQYGAITWTYTPKPDPDSDASVVFCNLCAHTEQMEMRPVNPAGRNIRRPIGCMQLQAYDITLEFEQLQAMLQQFINFLNTKVCQHVTDQIRKHASEHGIGMAHLSGNNIGPTAFLLSGFLSDDGKNWIIRGADEQNQPHVGITLVASSN
jgi:hypothetical protein